VGDRQCNGRDADGPAGSSQLSFQGDERVKVEEASSAGGGDTDVILPWRKQCAKTEGGLMASENACPNWYRDS
jgi:hypothetical protein